jgi:protein-tyrosine phosphatase
VADGRRRVVLDGCLNFRDLGGWGDLRWGRLYRSDSLHRVTDGDVARLVGPLALASAIDLRSPPEREEAGTSALDRLPVRHHLVPLADEIGRKPRSLAGADLGEIYLLMLQFAGPRVARVLALLADPANLPAVYFCAGGKDRTGVVSAVVLGLLGVPDDDIVADYALTAEVLPPLFERDRAEGGVYAADLGGLPPTAFDAVPDTMRTLLAAVRREFGSMAGYAESIGVGDDVVAALRENLTDP